MILTAEERKRFDDFTRYARFISEKFGVEIRFDGTNAHTDGNVITLPNIVGMSDDQVDFLYGILLHEVGHVRHSSFSKEDFGLLKTELHSYIANGIEDARIENLLMKEFGGAEDVFDKLYNQYCLDEDLMKKTFGIVNEDMNVFFAISIYLHNYIIKLPKKPDVKDLFSKKTSQEVLDFVKKHNVEKLVDLNPLKNWQDVVDLTNQVYDLLLKEYNDNSEEISILAQDMEIENQMKKADDLIDDSKKERVQLQKLQDKIKELRNQIKEEIAQKQPEFQRLNEEYKNLEQIFDTKSEVVDKLEAKARLDKKISDLNQKQKNSQEKIEKYTQDKENASEKKKNDLDGKAERQKQKYDKYELEKLELQKELDKLLNDNPSLTVQNQEELEKDCEKLDSRMDKISDKMREFKSFKSEHQSKLDEMNKQAKQMSEKITQDVSKYLKDMMSAMESQGLPVNMPMAFEPLKGWDEGNDFQKNWDEKVAKTLNTLVSNGVGFNLASDRDILIEINNAKDQLQSIDLSDVFKKDHNLNKFDSINEINTEVKNSKLKDDSLSKVKKGQRVVAVTTLYDCVKVENIATSTPKISDFKNKNSDLFRKVKNEFKKKMSFSKKDHFKGGKEEGELDARNMWKLASKIDTDYFEINRPKLVNKVTATIAMDISGSMDQDYTRQGENLRDLALLISEGLFECHIKHEVVGFHAPVNTKMREISSSSFYQRRSNNLETIVYKKFMDKNNKGLENIELKCTDNSDGESLKTIAQNLMKQAAKSRVLFLITDGKPYLSGSDENVMDQDLMNTVNWIKAQKIKLFVLGFNDDPKKYYGDSYFKLNDVKDFEHFLKKMG